MHRILEIAATQRWASALLTSVAACGSSAQHGADSVGGQGGASGANVATGGVQTTGGVAGAATAGFAGRPLAGRAGAATDGSGDASGEGGAAGRHSDAAGFAGVVMTAGGAGVVDVAGAGATAGAGEENGGAAGSSETPVNMLAVLDACTDACTEVRLCSFDPECDVCDTLDVTYAIHHQPRCVELAVANFECETSSVSIDCQYVSVNSDAGFPICNTKAEPLEAECGYAPSPPDECLAYCNAAAACALHTPAGECAFLCNLDLGAARIQAPACGEARRALVGCHATQTCAVIADLEMNHGSAAGDTCFDGQRAVSQACQ
jgi:hypothetical protein